MRGIKGISVKKQGHFGEEVPKNQPTATETRWKEKKTRDCERHWNLGKPSNFLLPMTLSELQSLKITSFHSFILNVYKYSKPFCNFTSNSIFLNLPCFLTDSAAFFCFFIFQQWPLMTQKWQWLSAVLKVTLFIILFFFFSWDLL